MTIARTEGRPRPLILVVDDEDYMREMMQLILRDAGFETLVVDSSKTALSLARRYTFDLVVSDIHRPEMGGLEFMVAFHALHPGVPVIIVSGYLTEKDKVRAFALGAFACLPKPFTVTDIMTPIRAALSLRP